MVENYNWKFNDVLYLHFQQATVDLSVEQGVSISAVIPAINGIRTNLNDFQLQTAKGKNLLKTTLRAMDARLKPNYESNIVCVKATIVDPRFKRRRLTDLTMVPKFNSVIQDQLRSMPNHYRLFNLYVRT